MAAGYSDQYLEQGSTFSSQLTLTDDYGSPYNLTNFTVTSRAKKSYTTANVAFNLTTQITNANNGIITLSLSAAASANIPYGKYVYDVIVATPSNVISRILEGQIFVSPGVTGVTNSYGTNA
jgi:hypothetical protein